MSVHMIWAKAHAEDVLRFAAEKFAEHGRGVVGVNLSGDDATFSYTTAEDLLRRGVGKFEVALKAMVAAYDPAKNATLVVHRDAEVMGCGMVEGGRLIGWSRPGTSLKHD